MDMRGFSVADLSEETLDKVKTMESELRQQSADDIVLIAYKNTDKNLKGGRQDG
ncbi:hypothetical protein QTG56_03065 [Rossellomorea sp. AcN35-11]|nr:hypothetical protein [Rossellomorea aquimaris]NMH70868.1 hypothetical protein [Bacillus sp. RO3]WJV30145.1 hypothetical protein QTG56_03065 [Rossellomorea sp. AcN35-11]